MKEEKIVVKEAGRVSAFRKLSRSGINS